MSAIGVTTDIGGFHPGRSVANDPKRTFWTFLSGSEMFYLGLGTTHETARFRQFSRRRSGRVAARSAAQAGRTYRIGFYFLPIGSRRRSRHVRQLRLNGFIEGQNLMIVSEGFEAS